MPSTEVIAIRLDKNLVRRIEMFAFSNNKTKTEVFREALVNHLFAEDEKPKQKDDSSGETNLLHKMVSEIETVDQKERTTAMTPQQLMAEIDRMKKQGAYGYKNFVFSAINMLAAGASLFEIAYHALAQAKLESIYGRMPFEDALLAKHGDHSGDVWKAKENLRDDAGAAAYLAARMTKDVGDQRTDN